MTFHFDWHSILSDIPFDWHSILSDIPSWVTLNFEWHSILSELPFWVTFYFKWHFVLSDIPFWVTFHFEWWDLRVMRNLRDCQFPIDVLVSQSVSQSGSSDIAHLKRVKQIKPPKICQFFFNILKVKIHKSFVKQISFIYRSQNPSNKYINYEKCLTRFGKYCRIY